MRTAPASDDGRLQAVEKWSRKIHGASPRHDWCMEVARALLEGREPPSPPGRWMRGTAESRVEVIRRILEGEL